MNLFTIGFTQKSAEQFFSLLKSADVKRVLDTRLNNRSQLAAFSKADDLEYFLSVIAGIRYTYAPEMAPTQEMLDEYKKAKGSWSKYEKAYSDLLVTRNIAAGLTLEELNGTCLLCSEHEPTHCHRKLLAEYLQAHFPGLSIVHLM